MVSRVKSLIVLNNMPGILSVRNSQSNGCAKRVLKMELKDIVCKCDVETLRTKIKVNFKSTNTE